MSLKITSLICILSFVYLTIGEIMQFNEANIQCNKTEVVQFIGATGPQGPPGKNGECQCKANEIKTLNDRITKLEEIVKTLPKNRILHQPMYYAKHCGAGLMSGAIKNSQITASSEFYVASGAHRPYFARINTKQIGWIPLHMTTHEWLQVDFLKPIALTGVITQGRTNYHDWVTSYKIQYGDSVNNLHTIQDAKKADVIFIGNFDQTTLIMHAFPKQITARYFRLVPLTWHRAISIRMEYLTCPDLV